MNKHEDLDFDKSIEEKMNYYPGTDAFKEIINEYRIENKLKNALMKDVYESVYSKDIKLILKQRNKKNVKTEMEEDEAEKLTNFKLATKAPQKLSTLISSIAEKKKNKEKKDEEEFKRRETNPDNRFGTLIRRQKSPPIKKSLLETIYENKKLKENHNSDSKDAKRNNKYRRNFIDKINDMDDKNSSISKNNSSEEESNENEEISIFKNRHRNISGIPINETLKTAADSRAYSGKSSKIFENTNSNYINISHNPDINYCK